MPQFEMASFPIKHHQTPVYRRIYARHPLFQLGVATLVLAALIFTIGYSAAAWTDWVGLWQDCSNRNNPPCIDTIPDQISWLNAVRATETLALTFFVLSVAIEFYQDVCSSPHNPPKDNTLVEVFAFLAGLSGLVGIIVYGVQYDRRDYLDKIAMFRDNKNLEPQLHWGYGLVVAGLGLGVIAAFIIALSRCIHSSYTAGKLQGQGIVVRSKPWVKADVAMTTLDVPNLSGQMPACYVVVHNQMIPVYTHLPGQGSNLSATSSNNGSQEPTRL